DRIAAVGPGLAGPAGARELDASGRIVLPGLGNAHTHAASHLARGRAGNWTLEDLLTHAPANYGHRTPEDDYLSAAIGAIEMLKTGCTSAYDLYMAVPAITDEAFEATVRAYTDVGVRVVLAPAVADVVFFQTVPGLLDLLPADLRRTVEGMKAAPTKGLLELTERIIRRWNGAAQGRIRAAVAPTLPNQATDEFLPVCADNQNLFEALRIASVVSTIRFPHETGRWLDAGTVWNLATAGSARVLGQAADLGAVAAGRKADLVLVRADSVFLQPLADPL